MFSHSRDCDSCTPNETAWPTGRPYCSALQALLVDAVAGFVQDAEERLAEMLRVVARCDPAVVRAKGHAEGMDRHVQPAPAEVEPDPAGGLASQRRRPSTEYRRARIEASGRRRACADGRHQRHQLLAQAR